MDHWHFRHNGLRLTNGHKPFSIGYIASMEISQRFRELRQFYKFDVISQYVSTAGKFQFASSRRPYFDVQISYKNSSMIYNKKPQYQNISRYRLQLFHSISKSYICKSFFIRFARFASQPTNIFQTFS